ncbi:MAG: hypothetical protein J0M04_23385 [Verrucomicrobia bacterium]|nr:hypothetical protein [Verrucomicrobiota bacterium]
MINTVWGSTDKPVASKRLAQLLSAEADLEGTLYIGYGAGAEHPCCLTLQTIQKDGKADNFPKSLVKGL